MNQRSPQTEFPNARAVLRIARAGPGLPERERRLTIWMRGSRFRVRDEAGSPLSEILDDLPGSRGLGAPPRSLEAMMDAWSASQTKRPTRGPTELFGDLASGEGYVKRGKGDAWPKAAGELAPLAELILAPDRGSRLHVAGHENRLNRDAIVFSGKVDSSSGDSAAFTEITRVVAEPYLLFEESRDGRNQAHVYVREIESLDEGLVIDADLAV